MVFPKSPLTNKAIVLDLDSTLICTSDEKVMLRDLKIMNSPNHLKLRRRIYQFPIETGVDGTQEIYWGVIRPGVNEFLRFCFDYFRYVIVWTAGKRPYAEAVVEVLFRGLPQPHLVWAYENCVSEVIRGRAEKIKPLTELVKKSGLPELSLENMFALDDNPSTYHRNPFNALPIPGYVPNHKSVTSLEADDTALPCLQKWLMQQGVICCDDVRQIHDNDNQITCDGITHELEISRRKAFVTV